MTEKEKKQLLLKALLVLLLLGICSQATAQDLEPRRWSHLPTGLNVFGLATGWTDGDIFFNPVLLIEDTTFEVYALGGGYVRTFDWWGKTGRIDIKLPYGSGRWEGLVNGELTTVRRRGFFDPRVRFSWNLYGAPALRGKEYIRFRQENPVNTTVGVGLEIVFPVGDYNETKLINLGRNRWVLHPQLGVLHQRNKWQFELTGSVFLFGDNDEFWNGNKLERDPLWFLQSHVVYAFKPGWWAGISGGFAHGGRSEINGDPKPDDVRARYIALSLGVPINKSQSLKFTYFTSDTHTATGANTNTLLAAWSINWGL